MLTIGNPGLNFLRYQSPPAALVSRFVLEPCTGWLLRCTTNHVCVRVYPFAVDGPRLDPTIPSWTPCWSCTISSGSLCRYAQEAKPQYGASLWDSLGWLWTVSQASPWKTPTLPLAFTLGFDFSQKDLIFVFCLFLWSTGHGPRVPRCVLWHECDDFPYPAKAIVSGVLLKPG